MLVNNDIKSAVNTPTVFVVFGATGDLATKKIFPSFASLFKANLLPDFFRIFACSRSEISTKSLAKNFHKYTNLDRAELTKFLKHITYVPTDITNINNLNSLKEKINKLEKVSGVCFQRIYYLSIAPELYEVAFENLGQAQFSLGCSVHSTKARIVIEKPFGYDFESSQSMQALLGKNFAESQVFRIDHFLGKQTVQNILSFRFANEIFEPIWNSKHIDNIQITLSESFGIENRGAFYDKAGALRDVVQNHMLQLLALVTMDQPDKFERDSIRIKKLEILENIIKQSPQEIVNSTVRGQYDSYRDEKNVSKNSNTESFSMIRLEIDNQRWKGVPIYLRTGKKLLGDVTSVVISFKEQRHKAFDNFWEAPMPNHITIQLQPTEGIGIRVAGKKPGMTSDLEPIDLEYCYRDIPNQYNPSAYERLLMDVISGDQTLFLGQVGASWKIIDPIRRVWDGGKPKLCSYKPRSWGPKEADALIRKDGREWLAPLLTICKI